MFCKWQVAVADNSGTVHVFGMKKREIQASNVSVLHLKICLNLFFAFTN